MPQRVLALAGGVGGAKLALGLARLLSPQELTIVVNTGDDETFHGLHVSPDLDTVMYTLAGPANPETGWGVAGDTFNTLTQLARYGASTWFSLGDKDMATHIRRTQLLNQGYTLSQVTQELCRALGVEHPVVPMSDQPLRTRALTDEGELALQAYFVQRKCEPRLHAIRFEGTENAHMSPQFREALQSSGILIFCPSNPLISIDPILAVPGAREAIGDFPGARVAVSPIVGGEALRGPAAKMLQELGEEVSCVGVARRYAGLCDIFIIDTVDGYHAPQIEALGMQVAVANTVMHTEEEKVHLARAVLELDEAYKGKA